jgi:O-antigen/teichoic acid export membrane protein
VNAGWGARFGLLRLVPDIAAHAIGLMSLRASTIAAKFALTLFIARYLGLTPLGVYGIIASATVLAPVLLGFGVSNNLGREAVRGGPSGITLPLLQYFAFLVPAYVLLGVVAATFTSVDLTWIYVFGLLLFLEHLHSDIFAIMTVAGSNYVANLIYFVRTAGWALIYMPLAVFEPSLRDLHLMGLFWLAGDILAMILVVALTADWRWSEAAVAMPRSQIRLPHKHGSMHLYFNDVANTGFVYIDRYIIGFYLSADLLGVYTFFWTIANAMSNLITNAVIQTRKGPLIQAARSSAASFNRQLRKVAVSTGQMAVGLSAIVIALMYVVIPHIKRPELDRHLAMLFIMSAALVFRTFYEVIGISFYAYRRDDITLYSAVVVLVASLVLNIVLVPIFGVWGASVVLLASYAIGVAARAAIVARGFQPRSSAVEGVPGSL